MDCIVCDSIVDCDAAAYTGSVVDLSEYLFCFYDGVLSSGSVVSVLNKLACEP